MSSALSLVEAERAAGAVFGSSGGLELPERFGPDVLEEVRRAREDAALFDLSFRCRLRFTGPDRVEFLHNLLSNDIRSLRPGTGCYATLLTRESRVVADGNVFCAEEEVFLDLETAVRQRAREHFERHLVADEVEIEDRFPSETTLGVHGPQALRALAAAGLDRLPEVELGHREETFEGVPIRVARVARTGDDGFDLWVPRPAAGRVWARLREAGIEPAGMAAFETLRVEAGIPRVGVDFDESSLVLEAGLERGIHFRKGCYLGQEVVERQSARGHVNRKLVGLRIQGGGVPEAGARLLAEGREVGRLTTVVRSPSAGGAIALGWVRREFLQPGTHLAIDHGSSTLRAEVVALPFHRRASS